VIWSERALAEVEVFAGLQTRSAAVAVMAWVFLPAVAMVVPVAVDVLARSGAAC
jgi:hypothetical protein